MSESDAKRAKIGESDVVLVSGRPPRALYASFTCGSPLAHTTPHIHKLPALLVLGYTTNRSQVARGSSDRAYRRS